MDTLDSTEKTVEDALTDRSQDEEGRETGVEEDVAAMAIGGDVEAGGDEEIEAEEELSPAGWFLRLEIILCQNYMYKMINT